MAHFPIPPSARFPRSSASTGRCLRSASSGATGSRLRRAAKTGDPKTLFYTPLSSDKKKKDGISRFGFGWVVLKVIGTFWQ